MRAVHAERLAAILVNDGPGTAGRRGSGYRITATLVLTAAHVVEGADSVRVRLNPGAAEWFAEVESWVVDAGADLAVIRITARHGEAEVRPARFGGIGTESAVLRIESVGFPRFKLRPTDTDVWYRDSHHAVGTTAVLSNRRENTLEITVAPPEHDSDPTLSPWEGMSGAAVWVDDRIIGVVSKHHRTDGLGRLAAVRLDSGDRASLGLPNVLPIVGPRDTAEAMASAYRNEVGDIAPDHLVDREGELAELAVFCAGDAPYLWWQAGPWAGKSALMSWFVLHPPSGIDVVSFFITARLSGQSDSTAYLAAVIDQLTALTGEPRSGVSGAARRGEMLRLLGIADQQAAESGRRLVLVVDGLDEDTGGGTVSSIAALLPRRPPANTRVVVASRPHPGLPDDVPDGHPLHECDPRTLTVHKGAVNLERRAGRELAQLYGQGGLNQVLLGLVTASGGGLTADDLAELTETTAFEVNDLLSGLFGRTVTSRTTSSFLERRHVYLFAHETLRDVATGLFGAGLREHRDRIDGWAQSYQDRDWPEDTPEYLLRGYVRELIEDKRFTRLVTVVADPRRHDRMLDLTGGDAMAHTEVTTAMGVLGHAGLGTLLTLAIERDRLAERNTEIPLNLPQAWTRLGAFGRAEALARAIANPYGRVTALCEVAETGTARRADTLLQAAEATAAELGTAADRDSARERVASAWAAVARFDKAESLAARIGKPGPAMRANAVIAEHLHACGYPERAVRALSMDQENATWLEDKFERTETLVRIAQTLVALGRHDDAESLIRHNVDSTGRRHTLDGALARIAIATAEAGFPDRARAMADTLGRRDRMMVRGALVRDAGPALAEFTSELADIAGDLPGLPMADWAENLLIDTAIVVGDPTVLAMDWSDHPERQVKVAMALADSGERRRAETVLLRVGERARRQQNRLVRARQLARISRAFPGARAHAVLAVAHGMAGETGQRPGRESSLRKAAYETIGREAVAAGDFRLAEAIATDTKFIDASPLWIDIVAG
ncbi:MAG: trypsin-like peptidase domain-containing protein, partial [Actinomycetota bacterium]|nr:trypsin-like peptidase domain-containing protein [Actinomycetota bacterium]